MNSHRFGEERFAVWAGGCDIWSLSRVDPELRMLLDHGFIADRACVWGGDKLEGHEIAVVSRTYCNDNTIDNPPAGLRCIRLPSEVMGESDPGTAIATVVVGNTPAARSFLSALTDLPASMMAYAISREMSNRYDVTLVAGGISCNEPSATLTKKTMRLIELNERKLNQELDEIKEALRLMESAARIARKIYTGHQRPETRIDSVTWRLADALLIIRDYAAAKWPGIQTPGADAPTGRGAMLSR